MFRLDPSVRSSPSRLDGLEAAFQAWVQDPAKPDVVELGPDRLVSMVELSRQLEGSPATLDASACAELGMPPGVTVGTAVAELLRATIDVEGPRCRSFRAASYYLRGLARLDPDLRPDTGHLALSSASSGGHPDVR